MQSVVEPLKNLGLNLIAVSPQLPRFGLEMVARKPLGFELLSDPGNRYAAALGLRFELPAELAEIYRSFGIDLAVCNGDDSWTLPMPARLIADGEGTVRAVDADPDYTVRPEPERTLEIAGTLRQG